MCGITGFVLPTQAGGVDLARTISAMSYAIRHRGPDADGVWVDHAAGIALGHRRLSILDLSSAGAQPMHSHSDRYVLVFNGEIYNHVDLRAELEGAAGTPLRWRGHSDTETLLCAIERWGLQTALSKCVGMFAFGLWDKQSRVLTLARDRFGEKPLYYGFWKNTFIFGSELRAIESYPGFSPEIDWDSAALFFSHDSIPGKCSIYSGFSKLLPGHLLRLAPPAGTGRPEIEIERYWSIADVLAQPQYKGSANDAVDALEELLERAVRQQMRSDVPVGAFLSGGVDSSTIVSLMQKYSGRPVKTFTIGFSERRFSEAEHAARVAAALETDHTELIVSADDAADLIPNLFEIYDEPFADSSQIPTIFISELARRDVTVSLTGDAGDELFCGYERYRHAALIDALPGKRMARLALAGVRAERAADIIQALPFKAAKGVTAKRLAVLSELLSLRSSKDRYIEQLYQPGIISPLIKGGLGRYPIVDDQLPGDMDTYRLASAIDALNFLPNDILVKLDRATMSCGLEGRAPFLDHRVAEFALRLPTAIKRRNGKSKWPLRQVLYKHVPPALVERPKMGFVVPLGDWLRGRLRDWADELITSLHDDDFLEGKVIAQRWREHLSGERDWEGVIWRVLMFTAWRRDKAKAAAGARQNRVEA